MLAAVLVGLLLVGCGGEVQSGRPPPSISSAPLPTPTSVPPPASATTGSAPDPDPRRHVLAISVDGLNPDVLEAHPGRFPALRRLLTEGAATLNARTAVEKTVTLPNHTGMLTGRRIDAAQGGHGLLWNDSRPEQRVPGAGRGVASIFTQAARADLDTALFTGKEKFGTFDTSWPIEEYVYEEDHTDLAEAVAEDLRTEDRDLTFLHLALTDEVGHRRGFMTPAYRQAVDEVDRTLADLLEVVEEDPELQDDTVLVLTSDHGGLGREHGDPESIENYRVPFVVWGAGVAAGDLYELNPGYRDPGDGQPAYGGPQPIRNMDLANLVVALLDLKAVPGSEFGVDPALRIS